MRYILYVSILTISAISLISCGQKTNQSGTQQQTPKALQDNKLDIKSYSRSYDDLTEQLYKELTENSPELKKLEDDLETLSSKPYGITEGFVKYNNKSANYYGSASNMANSISDSILKKRITAVIASSQEQYNKKTEQLNNLMKMIAQNGVSIRDVHSALKIVLTLPVIEKYQANNLPEGKKFLELTNEQERMIERIKKLTPTY